MTLTVRLSREFVTRVSELIARIGASEIKSGTEILGPLFGTRQGGLVTVETFRLVPVHNLSIGRGEYFGAFERLLAISKSELNSLDLIGWCCVRSADRKGLLESDAEFHNQRFPGATDIALILRPDQVGVSVELYARSPLGVMSSENYCWGAGGFTCGSPATDSIDFHLQAKTDCGDQKTPSFPRLDSPDRAEIGTALALSSDPAQGHLLPGESLRSRLLTLSSLREVRLSWAPIVLFLAAAASTMILGLRLHGNSPRASVNRPASAVSPNPASGPGMKVQTQQDNMLLVTWNHESPIVQSAKFAILYIDDGSQHKEIDFASGEMSTGSILYRPASGEVIFRLQLLGRDNSLTSESVRVLDGSMPVAMNANPAKPEASVPVMPVTANQGIKQPEPAKKDPRIADQKTIDSANGVGEGKSLSDALLQSNTRSPFKSADSIAPPPKLSITAVPQALNLYMRSLPEAPPPPASLSSVTPGNPKPISTYIPPRPLKRVLPNTGLLGSSEVYGGRQVEVHVDIDEAGHVNAAKWIKTGTDIPQALRDSALQAARQWVFEPAMSKGKPVASDHTIVFDFRPQAQ